MDRKQSKICDVQLNESQNTQGMKYKTEKNILKDKDRDIVAPSGY